MTGPARSPAPPADGPPADGPPVDGSSETPVVPGAEPMVRLVGVSKRFGDTVAVADAAFDQRRGEFLTILGPSGSGKTTVLRMIAGFIAPSAGEIYIHGRPVSADPPHRRSIGMVFQRLALFPHMTAAQNVAYPLKMRRFDPAAIPGLVAEYLRLVQLQDYGDRRIHQLSGGQQQRVAIARALVFKPDLLLLDEPLASLDKKLREDLQLEFRRIQQELGVTTINVTHDQREAMVMSDRVIVMDAGRIQQTADPVGTYRDPANRFVAGFLGVTNFLPGTVAAVDGGEATVRVGDHTLVGRCAEGAEALGRRADCALRAEQIRLADVGAEPVGADVAFDAAVGDVIFEGDRLVYTIICPALGSAALRVFDHDPLHHRVRGVGEALRIGWSRKDLLIFPKGAPGDRMGPEKAT